MNRSGRMSLFFANNWRKIGKRDDVAEENLIRWDQGATLEMETTFLQEENIRNLL